MAKQRRPKHWKEWIDWEFKGMDFEEIFGGVKDRPKKKKGVHADEFFDIGV